MIGRQTITGWLSAAIGLVALALLLQKWIKVPEAAVTVNERSEAPRPKRFRIKHDDGSESTVTAE